MWTLFSCDFHRLCDRRSSSYQLSLRRREQKELNNLLKRSVVLIAAASLSMLLLSEVMAAPLAAIFVGYDAGLLDMTVHAYSIYAVSFLFCGFSIFSSAFFTALGDGLTSALIAFCGLLCLKVPRLSFCRCSWA